MTFIRFLLTNRSCGAIVVVGAVCFLGLTGGAFAGGQTVTSAQNGDWGTGTTWDSGNEPLASVLDDVSIGHVVSITLAGEDARFISVGNSGGAGTLNVSSGSLNVTLSSVTLGGDSGGSNAGTLNLTGGAVSANSALIVGSLSAGTLNVSGGTLTLSGFTNSSLLVGVTVRTGELRVEGSGGTISITNASAINTALEIGSNGTLIIQPTANGAAGLRQILVTTGQVILDAASTLELDVSSFSPQVGNAWNVLFSPDIISGTFGTLNAPPGYTISQSAVLTKGATAQKIVITVTAIPAVGLPVAGYAALAALVVLLSMSAVIYLRRRMATARSL